MKVKICGLTHWEDAQMALELGASALGFVFFPASPRFISPRQVGRIVSKLPASALTVGVWVNSSLEELGIAIRESGVKVVQLHGEESPEFCVHVQRQFQLPVFKAFRIRAQQELLQIKRYMGIQGVLVDAEKKVISGQIQYGGTGEVSNWKFAKQARKFKREKSELFLAGGLNPGNVSKAIREVNPDGLDVSSGVEESPGKKSRSQMERFFHEIR